MTDIPGGVAVNDPWADVRNQIRTDPEWWPEVRRLLADADALLAVVRAQQKIVGLIYKAGPGTTVRTIKEQGGAPKQLWRVALATYAALPEYLREALR